MQGRQGVGDMVSCGRKARERSFVCSQCLALLSSVLSFITNISLSVCCDSFLLLYMQVLIIADGTRTSGLGSLWANSFIVYRWLWIHR